MLNNVPFDVVGRMGADYVIAVNVSAYRAPLFQDTSVTGAPWPIARPAALAAQRHGDAVGSRWNAPCRSCRIKA